MYIHNKINSYTQHHTTVTLLIKIIIGKMLRNTLKKAYTLKYIDCYVSADKSGTALARACGVGV